MKKLSKIKLIEVPRESILDQDSQSFILGGATCGTQTVCSKNKKSTCEPKSSGPCTDGSGAERYCGTRTSK